MEEINKQDTTITNPVPISDLESLTELKDTDLFAVGAGDGSKAYSLKWRAFKSAIQNFLKDIFQQLSEKGQPDGYTPLGRDGKVPSEYLPESTGSENLATADLVQKDSQRTYKINGQSNLSFIDEGDGNILSMQTGGGSKAIHLGDLNAEFNIGTNFNVNSNLGNLSINLDDLPLSDGRAEEVLMIDGNGRVCKDFIQNLPGGDNLATADLVQKDSQRTYKINGRSNLSFIDEGGGNILQMQTGGGSKAIHLGDSDSTQFNIGTNFSVNSILGNLSINLNDLPLAEGRAEEVLTIDEYGQVCKDLIQNLSGGDNLATADLVQTDQNRVYDIGPGLMESLIFKAGNIDRETTFTLTAGTSGSGFGLVNKTNGGNETYLLTERNGGSVIGNKNEAGYNEVSTASGGILLEHISNYGDTRKSIRVNEMGINLEGVSVGNIAKTLGLDEDNNVVYGGGGSSDNLATADLVQTDVNREYTINESLKFKQGDWQQSLEFMLSNNYSEIAYINFNHDGHSLVVDGNGIKLSAFNASPNKTQFACFSSYQTVLSPYKLEINSPNLTIGGLVNHVNTFPWVDQTGTMRFLTAAEFKQKLG